MNETLARFPQTIQEDAELLKRDQETKILSNNQRNCVLFRHEEKSLLHFVKNTAILLLDVLRMTKSEAQKLEFKGFSHKQIEGYLKYSIIPLLPDYKSNESLQESHKEVYDLIKS